jgi:hypothetical protein
MDPVAEFARLKDEIRRLEDRAQLLRAGFLQPGARLRSNRFEIVVKQQWRRVFHKDRLPDHILSDPRYREESASPVVTVRQLDWAPQGARADALLLVEPFDLPSPPAALAAPLSRPPCRAAA